MVALRQHVDRHLTKAAHDEHMAQRRQLRGHLVRGRLDAHLRAAPAEAVDDAQHLGVAVAESRHDGTRAETAEERDDQGAEMGAREEQRHALR